MAEQAAPVTVAAPTAEHHRAPLGIAEPRPRLSWVVGSAPDGWRQTGYEVEVRPSEPGAHGADPWRSGRLESPESVLVEWPAEPLASRARRTVRVRVWGTGGTEPSPWSPPLVLESGLLRPADWTAAMVGPDWSRDHGGSSRPALLRGAFELPAEPVSARLYASAHGLFELELNGTRVGDEALAPGWTSYHHRLRYRTLDVTDLLVAGRNALGAWLGDGWFRGRIGFHGGTRDIYGDGLGLLAQLEVVCADGGTVRFGTGPHWRAALAPTLSSGLYDGEHHDARLAEPGWSTGGFDDTHWHPVRGLRREVSTLVSPGDPPIRCTQEVEPVEVLTSPSGRTILDFGQNLVGRLRLRVSGERGTRITLRHAEVTQDGEICTRPLRDAEATDSYVLSGDGTESWEPRSTFHGFRYAEVTGWPGTMRPGDVVARVLHTDMRRTGWFTCSDPLLERLHENVVWSMRGNFLGVPTDCPQRDERLGWTGDIQVFSATACFLYDCSAMLGSWLADLAADQSEDGTVPFVVPAIPAPGWDPPWAAAVWGDAAVMTPWTLYQRFGDPEILRRQYASARAWVDLVAGQAGDDGVWRQGRQLGDWLDPAAPPEDPWQARTDPYLVAGAYFAASARTMAGIAGVLGESEHERHYTAVADRAGDAFVRTHVTSEGRLSSDTQTAYALALRFGLLPDERSRAVAGARLAELVAEDGHRIATGFAGTPVICDALQEGDALDTAYRLLMQRECPSWLYPVAQGATTIWERWDSLLPDGSVNPGEMTSFNHYALGAVADWLHRAVAGLAPTSPGYRSMRIAPRPGGGLTHAGARHLTPYGPAEVAWRLTDGGLLVTAEVPHGTTAVIDLPGGAPFEVGAGCHRFETAAG